MNSRHEIMTHSTSIFITGFLTSAALIVAIGAQNAFVLRQGIRKEHVLVVALICALSDAFLIALGVGGVGALIQRTPLLIALATYGGAAFLVWYGLRAARRALARSGDALSIDAAAHSTPLKKVVLTCLAFTYLNPHVYLDTIVLLGAISAQHPGAARWTFGAGAMSASAMWFFALAYGARLLAPLFQKPTAWRVLDAIIACVMFAIAASLLMTS